MQLQLPLLLHDPGGPQETRPGPSQFAAPLT
jgi:hypothetical protein